MAFASLSAYSAKLLCQFHITESVGEVLIKLHSKHVVQCANATVNQHP
jgi:hypothetical protein